MKYAVKDSRVTETNNRVEFAVDLQKMHNDCIFIQTSVIQKVKSNKLFIGNINVREKTKRNYTNLKEAFLDSFGIKY